MALSLVSAGKKSEGGARGFQENLWRVDLKSLGYAQLARRGDVVSSNPWFDPLCFEDSGTLIASFLTREAPLGLARREIFNQFLPLRLRAIFLNTAKRRIEETKEWPVSAPIGGVLFAPGGGFMVATRERLSLYSPNTQEIRRLDLYANANSVGDVFDLQQSPNGKSLLLIYAPNPQPKKIDTAHITEYLKNIRYSFRWVNGDDLHVVRSWTAEFSRISISETELATVRGSYQPGGVGIMIGTPGGARRTICQGEANCGYPRFVSRQVLALLSSHQVKLINTSGDVLFHSDFGNSEWLGLGDKYAVRAAADGKRFAITVWAHKGGSDLLDIDSHSVLKRIMVFDIPSRQWFYTLNAKKQKIKNLSGLALSPDGSLLSLIDQDGILELYRIPEPPGPKLLAQ